MKTTSDAKPEGHGPEKHFETGGTSEETSLTVKLLGDDWIVENAVGKSIGSANEQGEAIELARQAAASEKAAGITVLSADGSLEKTIRM